MNEGVVFVGSCDYNLHAKEGKETGFNVCKYARRIPKSGLVVVPNPFRSNLTIDTLVTYAIYSQSSRQIMKLSKGKHTLCTTSWQPDIYIVKTKLN